MQRAATKGGRYVIGVIPGDGIGKEVVPAAIAVLKAANAPFDYIPLEAGFELFQRTGTALPDVTVSTLKTQCHGSFFGAVSSPSHRVEGYSSPIVRLRKELDLYANVRPVRDAAKRFDMVTIRENTECLYVKQEEMGKAADGSKRATATRVITERASTRIARTAYTIAQQRAQKLGRPSLVTIVHKANVLSVTDGLFRESALDVAKQFPDVRTEEQLVDAMIYRLFREPTHFDVVVAPNLYGDIISYVVDVLWSYLSENLSVIRVRVLLLMHKLHS